MSPEAASSDPALGRRALITGAAVLGAAGVAAVVNASDAKAANGDTVRLGQGNSASGPTWITVRGGDRAGRDSPAFSVGDYRSSGLPTRAAIAARAAAGIGVYADGSSYGVWGRSSGNVGVVGSSDAAAGVHGGGTSRGVTGAAASAAGIGVEGIAESTGGTGVKGISTSGTGVEGTTTSGAQAVLGTHPATTGNGTGVKGTSASATGVGVTGVASHASGVTQGVRGDATASPLGTGVVGLGRANGVYGESRKAGGKGVYGVATQAEGAASHGVYGQTASSAGAGVYGKGPSYDPDLEWNVTSYGVYAEGAIASSGPAFLGVPEYGTTARSDSRLQEGTMTFSADFSTPTPRLYVLVKSSDGRLFKAELPLTAM
jgi:hypothetical protein